MNKFITSIVILIFLTSCSINSSQYKFLKNMIAKEDKSLKPEKNWTVYWSKQKIDVYAINFQDQILFADENINILYSNNQINKIIGLFPEDIVLEIKSNQKGLAYKLNERLIGEDSCKDGYIEKNNAKNRRYIRSCYESKSRKIYNNEVYFNSEGMIIGMKFKVHPNYPPIELSMK